MFRNLRAEMARNDVTAVDIANVIGVSDRSVRSKLSGATSFSITEAFKICLILFPDLDVHYLFYHES